MSKKDDFELNLAKLFTILWKRLPIILFASLLAAFTAFFLFRTPTVTKTVAKATFLIPREYSVTDKQVEYSDERSYSERSTTVAVFSPLPLDTYFFVSVAPATLERIASAAELPYSSEELSRMVSVEQGWINTYSFSVLVQNEDTDEALRIARAFADYLPGIIDERSAEPYLSVLDFGSLSVQSSGGADIRKTVAAACAAVFLAVFVIVVVFLVKEFSGTNPVFLSEISRLCPDKKTLSFFSSERDADALRRLRGNLCLALPDREGCRLIGLTAAHAVPSKDELALDLAGSLAEMGDRVLLIDADLRSHRLSDLAGVKSGAGLSELIRKNGSEAPAVEKITGERSSFSFLPAGDGAAEASELLDRRKLLPALRGLRSDYDLILLDLESFGPSIDAATVGRELDGVLIALRDEGFTRNQLKECIAQMEYASANVLGFVVFNKKTGGK